MFLWSFFSNVVAKKLHRRKDDHKFLLENLDMNFR